MDNIDNREQKFCDVCGGMKDLYIDGESVSADHWMDCGFASDIGCICGNETVSDQRETVLLGNGDILYIDGVNEKDDSFYTCSYYSPKTRSFISKVLVPIFPCVKSDKDGITYECLPAHKRDEKKSDNYKELVSLNPKIDYSKYNIWVKTDMHGLSKVTNVTKKLVMFTDGNGGTKYTNIKNIKGIYNYAPEQDLTSNTPKKKKTTAGKTKTKKSSMDKSGDSKKENKEPKKDKPTTKKPAKKKQVASVSTVPKTDNFEYISEVPAEAEYLKEDRHVYIDIDDNKKGMRVKRSKGGRVFWEDPKTGKYSAISLKKVNSNESIVVYEYK